MQARPSSSTFDTDSLLLELLEKELERAKNYKNEGFVSITAAKQIFTRDLVVKFCLCHGLYSHEQLELEPGLVDSLRAGSCLFFSVLLFAKLTRLAQTLVSRGVNDATLFDEYLFEEGCTSAGLHIWERQELANHRSRVGVVFENDRHQHVPRHSLLPFIKRENLGNFGSFGAVYRLTVAADHLKGYPLEGGDKAIVADKRIRAVNNNSRQEWRTMFREVETLQKRRHPNIIPLLASYSLEIFESEVYVKELHLVFPWADIDLAGWMTSFRIPDSVSTFGKKELQKYLYHSIFALVSGLSYMHREIDGTTTAHHDLKPKNILVVNGDFKIADFGHSHIRSILEGSDTEGVNGLGTYEYQPPEYWNNDGTRAQIKHGRAFDAYSLGCIIIELATLIVYGWELEKVSEFRNNRKMSLDKDRPVLVSVAGGTDASFHNNSSVVAAWIDQMKLDDSGGSRLLKGVLDIALGMMATRRERRLYTWEAEMDLYKILGYDGNRVSELERTVPSAQIPLTTMHNGSPTPLHRAIQKADTARITELWELGWSPYLKDQNGNTALDLLKSSTDDNIRKLESEAMLLREAARNGDLEKVNNIIGSGLSPVFGEALHEAIDNRHMDVIDCLLKTKAKEQLNAPPRPYDEFPVQKVVRLGDVTLLKRVLPESPDINSSEFFKTNNSPLYLATLSGDRDMVSSLLQHGAQILLGPAPSPSTAVHQAAHHETNEILTMLLNAKDAHSCLEMKDIDGQSPIMCALIQNRPDCFEVLEQHGASLHTINTSKNHAVVKDKIGFFGGPVPWGHLRHVHVGKETLRLKDASGKDTLVHIIAAKGLPDMLRKYMDELHPDYFDARNIDGKTPLVLAYENGHREVSKLLRAQLTHLGRPVPLLLGLIEPHLVPIWPIRPWLKDFKPIIFIFVGFMLFGMIVLLSIFCSKGTCNID